MGDQTSRLYQPPNEPAIVPTNELAIIPTEQQKLPLQLCLQQRPLLSFFKLSHAVQL